MVTGRFLGFLLVILASTFAAPAAAAVASPPSVGFEQARTAEGVEIGIWYPASGTAVRHRLGLYEQDVAEGAPVIGRNLPLVVMSHGSGGYFGGHYDTALALARAGFVVAALTHPGDNWRDRTRATDLTARPRALSALISHMLGGWPARAAIDPDRVGAFGFSAGGFTVLAAAGARPDLSRLGPHCAAHPGLYDCTLLREHPQREPPAMWHPASDARIKAIVVVAPALGFTFDRDRLAGVTIPVQLWRAGNDEVLPAPYYADAVRAALPSAPQYHDVAGAGHFDFLAPCSAAGDLPGICSSAAGFDRVAFHASFNAAVTEFFLRHLGRSARR